MSATGSRGNLIQVPVVRMIEDWIGSGGLKPAQVRDQTLDGVAYRVCVSTVDPKVADLHHDDGGFSYVLEVLEHEGVPGHLLRAEIAFATVDTVNAMDVSHVLTEFSSGFLGPYRYARFQRDERRTTFVMQLSIAAAGIDLDSYGPFLLDDLLAAARLTFKELKTRFGAQAFYPPVDAEKKVAA